MPTRVELFAVICLLAVCAAFISAGKYTTSGGEAVIRADGAEAARLNLAVDGVFELPGNVIEVAGGRVHMKSADCPGGLCVKQGFSTGGGVIVCLPNRVTVSLESGGGVDAVSR